MERDVRRRAPGLAVDGGTHDAPSTTTDRSGACGRGSSGRRVALRAERRGADSATPTSAARRPSESAHGLNLPKSSGRRCSRYAFSCSASARIRPRSAARRCPDSPTLGTSLAPPHPPRRLDEQRFRGKDRRVESERDGDGVGRPRVDAHELPSRSRWSSPKYVLFSTLRDLDAAQRRAHAHDDALAEVVRERALVLHVVHVRARSIRPRPGRSRWAAGARRPSPGARPRTSCVALVHARDVKRRLRSCCSEIPGRADGAR